MLEKKKHANKFNGDANKIKGNMKITYIRKLLCVL